MLTHEFADVNGIRLHYVTTGQGKLIMFLHGFPEFWYAWKNQLAEFGAHYQAVAVDLRGYNLSDKPGDVEQYRVKYVVQDIFALAAHLGHDRFILVGHDWGGAAAWTSAVTSPARVERLVIINSPHPTVFGRELAENPLQQRASEYMSRWSQPEAESVLSADNYAVLERIVLKEGLARGYFSESDRAAYLEAWSQPGALTGGLNYYRARGMGSQAARPMIVNVPTLVIWGERDTALLTGNLDGLEQYVPKLTVRRVPDASHWIVHEHPALVNRYIQGFIGT